MPEAGLNVARNIKALEWLKTELAGSLAGLFKSLFKGDTEGALDSIAVMIIMAVLLAKRLGAFYGQVEQRIAEKINSLLAKSNPIEEWYGDLSSLKEYLEAKR